MGYLMQQSALSNFFTHQNFILKLPDLLFFLHIFDEHVTFLGFSKFNKLRQPFYNISLILRPFQNKKAQKNLRHLTKKQSFFLKFFGPSYFGAALPIH